jgi:hypothetical protein
MSNDTERLLNGDAWHDFCDRLRATGDAILGEGYPDTPRDRAEGIRWLTRLMGYATRMEVEAGDPLYPCFVRYETPHDQWGGPNPDNIYLRANVDPRETYRIWGNVTGMRQAIFSLNEGDMQLGEFGVYSERSLDALEVEADGHLEIRVSPEAQAGNWMPSDPAGRLLTIRTYQSDWDADAAPVFHIERIGAEGVAPPPLDPGQLAAALDRSATWVERTATFWNQYTRAGWKNATPNHANPARPAKGGADNILYGSCFFELASDEALLVECDAPDADYWSFTLHTLGWLESGAFADRQTSLSAHQAHVDDDGRLRVVVAEADPGVPNWIDSEARSRGLLVYRWVWARTNPVPEARVVPIAALRSALPETHPHIDAEARRRALARRRESAWNRFQ